MSENVNQSCSYCGGEYPSPVEYHHTEEECREKQTLNAFARLEAAVEAARTSRAQL